ncbi:hypothetical protein AC1031_004888 [Aphanomyces cochlioides]|nr:hypothetical protein AC1031_004888 [Aphanomyces cochlioides]
MLLLHAVDAVDNIDIAETLITLTKAEYVHGSPATSGDENPAAGSSDESEQDDTSSLIRLTRLAQEEFKFMKSPTGVDESWTIASVSKMEQGLKRMKVEELSLDGHYSHPDDEYTDHDDDRVRKMSVSSWSSNDSEATTTKKIGSYSPEDRAERIQRYLEKRKHRTWGRKINYGVRKNFADSRLRVKGRFVKKEDEELLCLYLSLT